MKLLDTDLEYLISLSKRCIEHVFLHSAPLFVNPRFINEKYHSLACTFVGLNYNGYNVGCKGNFNPMRLFDSILKNTFAAGFNDERFLPIKETILDDLILSLYFLEFEDSIVLQLNSLNELEKHIDSNHSLIVDFKNKKSIMLSAMQARYKSKSDFLLDTCKKNSIPDFTPLNKIKLHLIPTITYSKKFSEIESCKNYV